MEPKGLLVWQYGPINSRYPETNKIQLWRPKTLKFLPIPKSLVFQLFNQQSACIFHHFQASHMFCPSPSPWLIHPNNIS
jgi:hypothetical protein